MNMPETEQSRLKELRSYEILDTLPDQDYDDLVKLAAEICAVPISAVSLVDTNRQWFKSILGLDVHETKREVSFCAHTIGQQTIFEVPDAALDKRFAGNELVTGAPYIRFYAGAPLTTESGHNLGALCVIDSQPRTLTEAQKSALMTLARNVMSRMELRKKVCELQQSLDMNLEIKAEYKERQRVQEARLKDLFRLFTGFMDKVPSCCYIKDNQGRFLHVNPFFAQVFQVNPQGEEDFIDATICLPDALAGIRAQEEEILWEDQPEMVTEELARADGRVGPWLSYKFPFRGRLSDPPMLAVISFDTSVGPADESGPSGLMQDVLEGKADILPEIEVVHPVLIHDDEPEGSARVLVVEDNPAYTVLALRYLRKFGYTAKAVESGEEALRSLEHEEYDIVLMDCQMPGMDGYDTTRQIREREARLNLRQTPVIAFTASSLRGARNRCLEAGMSDYFPKALNGSRLHSTLESWRPVTPPRMDALVDCFLSVQPRLGRELGVDLITFFINQTTSRLAEFRIKLASGKKINESLLFRSLAGDSGALGMKRLCSLSRQLEELCKGGDSSSIQPVFEQLEQEFCILCGRNLETVRGA